jgi:hypothetical protein
VDVHRDTPAPQLNRANHGSWNSYQTGQMHSNPKSLQSRGVRVWMLRVESEVPAGRRVRTAISVGVNESIYCVPE